MITFIRYALFTLSFLLLAYFITTVSVHAEEDIVIEKAEPELPQYTAKVKC